MATKINLVFDGVNPFISHKIGQDCLFGYYKDGELHTDNKTCIIDLSSLPSSLKEIDRFCFINNKRIKEYISGPSLEAIGNNAFTNSSLEKVIIAGNTEYIGVECFAYCANLTDVVINAECVNIEDFAFAYCDKLETISFNGFANIMPNAFIGCTNLKEMHINKCEIKYFKKVIVPDGVTIFTKKDNPLYRYCLRNGIKVKDDKEVC